MDTKWKIFDAGSRNAASESHRGSFMGSLMIPGFAAKGRLLDHRGGMMCCHSWHFRHSRLLHHHAKIGGKVFGVPHDGPQHQVKKLTLHKTK